LELRWSCVRSACLAYVRPCVQLLRSFRHILWASKIIQKTLQVFSFFINYYFSCPNILNIFFYMCMCFIIKPFWKCIKMIFKLFSYQHHSYTFYFCHLKIGIKAGNSGTHLQLQYSGGWSRRIKSLKLGWATWQDPITKIFKKKKMCIIYKYVVWPMDSLNISLYIFEKTPRHCFPVLFTLY
jgi:hypothetical protein